MKHTLIRLGLSALVSSALFGCGGGSDGVNGANGSTVTVPVNLSNKQTIASNTSTPTSASVQAWKALEPQMTVNGVTIASPPVVKFTVTDAAGNAVVGLGNTSKSSTATVAALTNLRFTLAKLVPATATEPSKWVSYLVLKPPTVAQAAGTVAATDSCTADKKWCGTYPTTDSEGTLVDNGDGTYKYTFARDVTQAANIVASLVDSTDGLKKKVDLGSAGDLSYNPSLTHRLGIQISGAAPGTGSNVPNATTVIPGVNIAIPANVVYDFRPDGQPVTSTRSIVDLASCASCHNGKGLAHGGGRKDPNYCVTCHTDQVKYGMSAEATRSSTLALSGTTQNTTSVVDGRAIGNLPNFVHKIHMGAELKLTGYNYIPNTTGVGMKFNEVEWIQDPRNCTKCHSGADKTDINQATKTKDGDNWKNKPSRLACGACHDNVNFATGVITTATGTSPHSAGPAADDSSCSSCHTAAVIAESHRTEAPTANNPTPIDGISTISYEIKSVKLNTSKQPVIEFRIIKDGAPVTAFATPTPVQNPVGTKNPQGLLIEGQYNVPATFQPIPGFTGGPTFYAAFAVPQDGVTSPADFNTSQSVSLANLLVSSGSPKAGTLTGPDSSGYFIATLTGNTTGQSATVAPATPVSCPKMAATLAGYCVNPSPIVIPPTAKMLTGAMIGNFTQRTFTTGAKATALTTKYGSTGLLVKTPLQQRIAAGYTARRVLVDNNKCEACHEQLGTAVEFHGGARNDATACAICHTPNRTSGGWSANGSTFIHGIHAGTSPASVAAITGPNGIGTATVGVPGSGAGGAGTGYSSGKRYVPFSYKRDKAPGVAGGFNAAAVVYPGILKRCDNCHVPNAVNFGANGSALLPTLLWSTSAAGTLNAATDTNKVFPRDPVTGALMYNIAPVSTNYGVGFSFTPEGSVASGSLAPAGGTTVNAAATTLIESPVTSACFACHDTSVAKAHMTQYGGVMYGARSASTSAGALVNNETCLICHGMGRDQDAAVVHSK
jgi:OmcA/MtrC family decaheme c-type cytochrome